MTPDVPVPGPEWRLRAGEGSPHHTKRRNTRMQTIAIILVVLWLLGYVSGYAMGGLLHLLLVIAVVMFAVRFFTGRRVA
jgi:hypothetical protein